MWKGAAHWCCRLHLLVHTMRSARDPSPVLGTNTSLLQRSGQSVKDHLSESLTWCRPDTSRWKTQATVCACVLLKILPHMQAHSGGLYSIVVPRWCAFVYVWGDFAWKEKEVPAHNLHCNAWAEVMVSELIQSLRYIHFLQYLKHIIEGGGANSFILINQSLLAKRLHVSNCCLLFSLVGFFPAPPLIYCTSTGPWVFEVSLIHRRLTVPDRLL